jgi:hypothetical protein
MERVGIKSLKQEESLALFNQVNRTVWDDSEVKRPELGKPSYQFQRHVLSFSLCSIRKNFYALKLKPN